MMVNREWRLSQKEVWDIVVYNQDNIQLKNEKTTETRID